LGVCLSAFGQYEQVPVLYCLGSPSSKFLEDSEDWVPTRNLTRTQPVQAADKTNEEVLESSTVSDPSDAEEEESSFMDSPSSFMMDLSGFHHLNDSYDEAFNGSRENVSLRFKTPPSATQTLQDRLTNSEVDKLELQAKLQKLDKDNNELKERIAALEERVYEEISKMHKIEKESTAKVRSLAEQASATKDRNAMIDKTEFFCLKAFSSDNAKIKFYTGLPEYATFQWVLEVCCCHMKSRVT